MAQSHGVPAIAIHQDHMQEEHLFFLHDQGVAFVKHREIDPDRIVNRAHAIATSLEPRMAIAVTVEHGGMGVEYIAHRCAWHDDRLAGDQCFLTGRMHPFVAVRWLANDDRAHHRCVVAGVGARPFQCELVGGVEVPAAREIAAQQRAVAGPDNELIARVIAAAFEHSALHFREDIALERARLGRRDPSVQRVVRQGGGTAASRLQRRI